MTRNQGNGVVSGGVRGGVPHGTSSQKSVVSGSMDSVAAAGSPHQKTATNTKVVEMGVAPQAAAGGTSEPVSPIAGNPPEQPESDPPQYFSSVPLTFPAHPLILVAGTIAILAGTVALCTIPIGFLTHGWQIAAVAVASFLLLPAAASLVALRGSGAVDHSATVMTLIGTLLVVSAGWFWLITGGASAAIGPTAAPLLALGVTLLAVHGIARKIIPLVGVYEAVFNDGLTTRDRFALLGGASEPGIARDIHREVAKDSPIDLIAGSVVSADTEILSGSVTVDERRFSGVPTIRVLDEGEVLFGGSTILAGEAKGRTLSTGKGSCLALLESLIAKRFSRAAHEERLEESTARRSTLLAIIFCSVAAAISFAERSVDPTASLLASGGILICSLFALLRDSLLIHRLQFLTTWSRRGVVVPTLSSLDTLTDCSEVSFEFPLVEEHSAPVAERLEVFDDRVSREELAATLLSLVGRAEGALFKSAAQLCGEIASNYEPQRVLGFKEFGTKGICGVLHGVDFSVGTEELLIERGIFIQPHNHDEGDEAASLPRYYVAVGSDVVACFTLTHGSLYPVLAGQSPKIWGDFPKAAIYTGATDSFGTQSGAYNEASSRLSEYAHGGIKDAAADTSADLASSPTLNKSPKRHLLVRCQAPTKFVSSVSPAGDKPVAGGEKGTQKVIGCVEAYPMTEGAIGIHRDAITLLGGDPAQLGLLIPAAQSHLNRVERIGYLLQGVCILGVISVFLGLLVPVVAAVGFPLALFGTRNLRD